MVFLVILCILFVLYHSLIDEHSPGDPAGSASSHLIIICSVKSRGVAVSAELFDEFYLCVYAEEAWDLQPGGL